MKTGLTFIGFVMDRSGSMANMALEASNAFNNFIEDQQKVDGEALVTFVEFDDNYRVVHEAVNINDIITQGDGRYVLVPGGMTALLDAIGRTINSIGTKLNDMPESERPEKVIIGIMTDGNENSSQEFNREQIRALIQEQESKYNWTFMFFGANQDAIAAGASIGVSVGNSANFAGNADGAVFAMSNVSRAMTNYRSATYDMSQKETLVQDSIEDENGETSN